MRNTLIQTERLTNGMTSGYVEILKTFQMVMHTRFPATVMVLGVQSNDKEVMTLHIFCQGVRVNAAEYKELLMRVVKPWTEGVSKRILYTY